MQEHRLIERMISQMNKELLRMKEMNEVNSAFIDVVVDFIRVYADRCHHGKEEGVLFRELSSKQMSSEHVRMVRELIDEHVYARRTTSNLAKAKERYVKGDGESRKEVGSCLMTWWSFTRSTLRKKTRDSFTHQWIILLRKNKRRC